MSGFAPRLSARAGCEGTWPGVSSPRKIRWKRTELAFQSAQRAKCQAADALRHGDVDAASRAYDDAGQTLKCFAAEAAPAMASEIAAEADLLLDLSERARFEDASRMAKFSEADRHLKDRKRGRRAARRSDEDV